MIERYTRPEMASIWSDESRYRRWLEIEILVCEARARAGEIPPEAAVRIRRNAAFSVEAIEEVEAKTRHDVIAFVTVVGKSLGEDACYFHEGLTSSDILDTCLASQLKDAAALLMDDLHSLESTTRRLALEHKNTLCIGRTHGIHAEPITFGLKCAGWNQDIRRAMHRLEAAVAEIAVGKISGAVGNFAHLDPEIEAYVMEKMALTGEPVATQVVQRDRHAAFMCALALAASAAEKIALEIRHCQRSEVMELAEPFGKGQQGSSAMPHKKNPILCENISGLCRLVKGYTIQALENVALWHERDISHSSVERVILPDATIALDFLLHRTLKVLDGLVVNADMMRANIDKLHGLIFSQKVLLALTGSGVSREEAYRLVQRNALKTWSDGISFLDQLLTDPDVMTHLDETALRRLFDLAPYTRHIDAIYRRAGIDESWAQ
ncbi:MAG TPA: adenylosuccinate lyase [bacterium]|nr:adenylosuccinate lyase [bacterium]